MSEEKKQSEVFKKLSQINVNDKTEKKNGLTYLSWAWAWGEAKKIHPTLKRKVYERENGVNYFDDSKTAWVKVGVTIDGLEEIDYLPIMDYRNKSIKLDDITSFDVNKAIQRSTTKALALHGLGLYIYAGEDLPMLESEDLKPQILEALKKVNSYETLLEVSKEYQKQITKDAQLMAEYAKLKKQYPKP